MILDFDIINSVGSTSKCNFRVYKIIKYFNNNFYIHFFVSTKKRTKESDPKRMLLPAPENCLK